MLESEEQWPFSGRTGHSPDCPTMGTRRDVCWHLDSHIPRLVHALPYKHNNKNVLYGGAHARLVFPPYIQKHLVITLD